MKVSRMLQATTFLATILLYPYRVTGHDGWLEVSPALVEEGQLVTISLFQGNHSNEHRSYRLAGKWRPQDARLMVAVPAGQISDLTRAIVDFGEVKRRSDRRDPRDSISPNSWRKSKDSMSRWRGKNGSLKMQAPGCEPCAPPVAGLALY